MNNSIKILAMVFALITLSGCDKLKDGYENGYKDLFKKGFMLSCVPSARNSGADEKVANDFCECTAKHLTDRLSTEQLEKLNKNPPPPELQPFVQDAIKACKPKRKGIPNTTP